MAKNKKTGNFLKEIQSQAEIQRNLLINELSAAKKEAVSKAEIQFEIEAEKYITRQLNIAETKIKSEYAVKTLKAQGELFKLRDEMSKKVFEKAKEKLVAFSSTPEYKDLLFKLAKEMAEFFENNSCIINLKRDDMKYCDEIKGLFNGEIKIEEDKSIVIGGIKGYCHNIKMIADNTLDSKLDEQKAKFVEEASLKIV